MRKELDTKKEREKTSKEVQQCGATATNATKKVNNMAVCEFTVNIDQNQAQEFARMIFSDIATYIGMHQTEYEEFLQNENERSES